MMALMIRGPPEAPRTARRRPSAVITTMGDIEDCGFFPGRMKLGDEGSRPYTLACSGVEKSSI